MPHVEARLVGGGGGGGLDCAKFCRISSALFEVELPKILGLGLRA